MSSLKTQARRAGLLYLLGALVAPFGLVYVPTTLIERGNAAATADNIRGSENLLRMGIASEILSAIIFVFLVLALYQLFKGVNQKHAMAMAVLLIVSCPLSWIAAVQNFAALELARGVEYISTFDQPQRDSLAYLFLRLRSETLGAAWFLWGLWLFPFGVLIWRSGFIPRWLGVCLWIAGTGYLIEATTHILVPHVQLLLEPVLMGTKIFEVPIIFWLLIWGAREKKVVAEARA